MSRRALLAAVLLLIAAAAALGGAAALDWAQIGFSAPLRGTVPVRVTGSDLIPVLGPLALLALAAVAAVLATGGWARPLLGALLLIAAGPPGWAVLRVTDQDRLVRVAEAPARAVPDGTVAVFAAGPTLAVAGTALLAAAGVLVLLRGSRMPRMGRRYRAPTAHSPTAPSAAASPAAASPAATRAAMPGGEHSGSLELWERIDAGEDPTASGDPR